MHGTMRAVARGFLLLGFVVLAGTASPVWADGPIRRVNFAPHGRQLDGDTGGGPISPDGHFIMVFSYATNLLPRRISDVGNGYLRDRKTGITTLVTVGTNGRLGNARSIPTAISVGGRYVVFESEATNLAANDTNNTQDIFVHDRETSRTEQVNVGLNGGQANGVSFGGVISADGRYVAFASEATNLVADDTNNVIDVFVRDRKTGTTTRVSVGQGGAEANEISGVFGLTISADGRFVAFGSRASNLVSNDSNGVDDVFVHDRNTEKTEIVSVASDGTQGDHDSSPASISANGRYVLFVSEATSLVPGGISETDIYLRDRKTGKTTRQSLGPSGAPAGECCNDEGTMSGDGRFVVFTSYARLVPGDTDESPDVYLRDRKTAKTTLVSEGLPGTESEGDSDNQGSGGVSISADGRVIGFNSDATNLVRHDTNAASDFFIRAR